MARTEYTFAVLSDTGMKRRNNEDSSLVLGDAAFFCVADGMGGAEGGAIASQQAVKTVAEGFGPQPHALSFADKIRILHTTLHETNRWIRDWAAAKGIRGSGTTFVGLVLDFTDRHRSTFLHAGDSRGYRFRHGTLAQITRDHSVANAFNAQNEKVPAKFRNVIMNAIGTQESFKLEETPVTIEKGDVLLLCSDGLPTMVPDDTIAAILRQHAATDVDAAAKALVKAANDAGGADNVTVVLVRIETTESTEIDDDGPITAAGARIATDAFTPTPKVQSSGSGEKVESTRSLKPVIIALIASLALGLAWFFSRPKESSIEKAGELSRAPDAPLVRSRSPDDLRTMLATHLESGRLGDFDASLKRDSGGALDTFRAMPEETERFNAWFSEWSRCFQSPDSVSDDARAYIGALNDVAAVMGIPPFSDHDLGWPQDAESRANVYCRMLYLQQNRFAESAIAFLERVKTQNEIGAKNPAIDAAIVEFRNWLEQGRTRPLLTGEYQKVALPLTSQLQATPAPPAP